MQVSPHAKSVLRPVVVVELELSTHLRPATLPHARKAHQRREAEQSPGLPQRLATVGVHKLADVTGCPAVALFAANASPVTVRITAIPAALCRP
jgi:hypothetical protein